MSKRVHVTPHPDGGWQTKREGVSRAGSRHDTQGQAIDRAREQAIRERGEVVIHRPDGRIRDDATRQLVLDLGFVPVVPPKSNRVDPWEYDRALYKRRNEVERLFRRLKGFRRIFSRFEKLDRMFLGFIVFVLIVDALR